MKEYEIVAKFCNACAGNSRPQTFFEEAEGKRLHMSDEHFMKDAEHLLYNEWQYVLNVDKVGLMEYIFRRIESN